MPTGEASGGPLRGLKVLDFGQYIAGPGAAMMLADQGADVIRIERPDGPAMDTPANAVLNRGKRSLVLDLKSPSGVEAARGLVRAADVLIENFRPGVMTRLGLGYNDLSRTNPSLIYLSLPGYLHDDVANAGTPAYEGVVAAAMGQYTDMGLNRVLLGVEASYSPLSLASAYASVLGALSATLALRSRLRSGRGDWIETPLSAALMEGLAYNSMWLDDCPERYKSLREREIARRKAAGLPLNLTYDELQAFLDPFYRTYRCRNGRYFYVVAGSHVTHAERTLKVLGLWEEMVAAGVPQSDPYRPIRDWPNGEDCSLKAYPITEPWASRLTMRMSEAFLTRDAEDWERRFGDAGAPGVCHRTTREWLRSDHPRAAGLVVEVDDPHYGRMLQPGPIAWLKGCPPVAGSRPTPASHERLAEIEAGFRTAAPPPASEATAAPPLPWLDGITILDLTNVIAGPTIAGTLARFGARVIKLDPLAPTYDPWNTVVMGLFANRGKESALVDLKSEAGRDILERLVRRADIVTINAMTKQLAGLGLDYEALRRINPRVVLCHVDAFGGPTPGPRSDDPGYDDLVQASTGIMERFGGAMETVEEHAHFGTIDVLGGFCAAFAVSLALLRRETTGRGDVARASLAAAGQWLQSRFMFDYDGRPPFDEPRGREAKGEGAAYRCYRASDGWFFLACRPEVFEEVTGDLGLAGTPVGEPPEEEDALSALFATRPLAHWREILRHRDVAVQPLVGLGDVRAASLAAAADARQTVVFRREERHPSGRAIEHVEPTGVRPHHAPIIVKPVFEKYGASTRRLLAELGFSERQIDHLHEVRAVSGQWTDVYLPD